MFDASDRDRLGQRQVRRFTVPIWAVAAVAAFGGLLLLGYLATPRTAAEPEAEAAQPRQGTPAKFASTRSTHKGIGTLIGMKDCQWGPSDMPTEPHSRLQPGKLTLTEGVAEIRLDRGAVLILEGPAEFELRTSNSATLLRGKVVAHVPQRAKGFELQTPSATITDLGLDVEVASPVPESATELREGDSLKLKAGDTIHLGPGESKRLGAPEPERGDTI